RKMTTAITYRKDVYEERGLDEPETWEDLKHPDIAKDFHSSGPQAAVGLATALDLACEEREGEAERLRGLRDRLQHGIMDALEDVYLNGHSECRLPHLLNVSIVGVEGESLLLSLDAEGIAVSTGSACTSGTLEPSHVLTAMDIPAEIAHGSLRFSLGRVNTEEDVDYVLQKLPPVVQRLRDMSPTYEG
ncbi:MAG: aminotransferase class V-fold PLP-dependent enzyme, partial [Planctomycetota bacterium]